MKRLISLSILLLLFVSTCDSPVGNSGSDQQLSTRPDNAPSAIRYGTQPVQPDSIRQVAWQQFKSQNGPEWRVTWNEQIGIPLTVFSGISKEQYPGAPEQAARTFL